MACYINVFTGKFIYFEQLETFSKHDAISFLYS